MGKSPGVHHLHAGKAFQRAGFAILRQSSGIIMSDGLEILVIPRHNPLKAVTMFGIIRDSGLTPEQFRKLL